MNSSESQSKAGLIVLKSRKVVYQTKQLMRQDDIDTFLLPLNTLQCYADIINGNIGSHYTAELPRIFLLLRKKSVVELSEFRYLNIA